MKGTNLWLCLVNECHYTGCGESIKDHSSLHAEVSMWFATCVMVIIIPARFEEKTGIL